MLNIFKTEGTSLKELTAATLEKGAWIHLVNPSMDELNTVTDGTGVPMDFLGAALDEEERSRLEVEENCILVITNIPLLIDENNFDTLPLGIVITQDYFITVCLKHSDIFSHFRSERSAFFDTQKKTRFLFQIQYKVAELYLKHLAYISRHTDRIEQILRKSMQNRSLFHLFEIERSLVYFTTALKDNGVVLKKLLRLRKSSQFQHLLQMYEEDEDLLEDVIIEDEQAVEMVEMHRNVLSGMMNAFASIISNNLNMVMKFLATITIILAVPTMIASFWGMNVRVPWGISDNHPLGFLYVVIFAVASTSIIAMMLLKKEQL
ncbi:MAG: magnesium transporter CorA family protein [Candidatus Eremiobacteraeota bacterium]|nr:magnesium transporter CorA family protein [Candidatus Eremiobacteraeota bacterium]